MKTFPIVFILAILMGVLFLTPSEGRARQAANKPKILIAAIPIDVPPTYFKEINTNEAAGFAVDLMNAIGKQAGYSIVYQFKKDWTDVIDAVRRGTADIAPELGITEERKKVLSFTSSTDAVPMSIFVRGKSGITKLRSGMTVGVMSGSAVYDEIRKQYGNTLSVTHESLRGGLYDLLAGHIDAFCCPAPTMLKLAGDAGLEDHIRIIGAPLMELKRAIALRRDNKQLLAELNKAVNDFVQTSSYQQIYTKWYGNPKPYWALERKTVFSAAVVLFIVVAMAVWRHSSIVSLNKTLVTTKEKLKRSEYFSNTIIETEPECVKLLDADGGLIFMNKAGLNMIQADSLEQVKGLNVLPLVASEYRDAFISLTKDVCSGGSGMLTFEITGLLGRRLCLETRAVPFRTDNDEITALLGITRDITERKMAEEEKENLISELQEALATIKRLQGILPICSSCKKIRDDKGSWKHIEDYISQHTEAEFSHGFCEECAKKIYPAYFKKNDSTGKE